MSKTPIEILLDRITYIPIEIEGPPMGDEDLPYITHEGILQLGEIANE